MAETAAIFQPVLLSAFNKLIDLDSDAIKVALHTNLYTPNYQTHQYWDVSATNQASGSGYTAGGFTVPSLSLTLASGTFKFDAGDVSMAGNTVSARHALIYDSTPASNKPLIIGIDFGEDKVPLSLTWHASGIFTGTFA